MIWDIIDMSDVTNIRVPKFVVKYRDPVQNEDSRSECKVWQTNRKRGPTEFLRRLNLTRFILWTQDYGLTRV